LISLKNEVLVAD